MYVFDYTTFMWSTKNMPTFQYGFVGSSHAGPPGDFHKDFHRFEAGQKGRDCQTKQGKTLFLREFAGVYRRDIEVIERHCSNSARPAQQTQRQQ